MKNYFFLVFFIAFFVFAGAGCPTNEDGTGEVDYEEDVQPLIEEVNEVHQVRGSCNVIAEKSACVDYAGTMWTEEQMRLNCQGAGSFSLNTCPYSDRGGCVATPGTITETVVWSYGYGGQPISEEEAGYAADACNAGPVSNWVSPDYFLTGE
ncbi:MAG: hypothetical protein ABIG32_02060 [Candidatus Uhrbacteria bacterium]|nr:hypothetical protein [Patescibacteria group bacterium]MBU1906615.1 hypothetical protein [Patescibacteria group bacterium]